MRRMFLPDIWKVWCGSVPFVDIFHDSCLIFPDTSRFVMRVQLAVQLMKFRLIRSSQMVEIHACILYVPCCRPAMW